MVFKPLKFFFSSKDEKKKKIVFSYPEQWRAEGPWAEKVTLRRVTRRTPWLEPPFMKHVGLKKENPVAIKQPFFDAEQKASLKFSAAEQEEEKIHMSLPSA